MAMIILNKPFRVLSQFSASGDKATLAKYVDVADVYPAGRLDYESEGLLLLTDDGRLQARIAEPRNKLAKHYWAQVEGTALPEQLATLTSGVRLNDGVARALNAVRTEHPQSLWRRKPPIRQRTTVPTDWLEISIDEGRNRQVRRMTAAVGLPTLRLIRYRIGPWNLGDLQPGEYHRISNDAAWQALHRR